MTQTQNQTPTASRGAVVKKVLSRCALTICGLLVAFGGIKFWAQTMDHCEQEGNSYTFCLVTMRYQAAKEVINH